MSTEIKTIIILTVLLAFSVVLNIFQDKARDKQALRFCDLLDAQKWERHHLGCAVEEQQKKILALEVDNVKLAEELSKVQRMYKASEEVRLRQATELAERSCS